MAKELSSCRRARPLLGALVSIEVEGEAVALPRAIAAAFSAVERVQRVMSFHDSASDLSRFNRAACGEVVAVDPWLIDVVRASQELCARSEGLFDPGIAPRLVAMGRLPSGGSSVAIEGSSVQNVQIEDSCTLRKTGPVQLDLGGIAKGFAVDVAVKALIECGAAGGIVNAGGDLRVFGERDYQVVLRHPFVRGRVSRPFNISSMACCTSVNDIGSESCVHPWNSRGIGRSSAVTVLGSSALWADALTKVALLMGQVPDALLRHYEATVFCHGELQASVWQDNPSSGALA